MGAAWSIPLRSAETQRHGRSGHFFRETARLCSRHTGRASLLSMAAWFALGTPKRLLWALHGAFRCSVPRSAETQRHGRSGHLFRQTARLCSRHTGRAALLSVAAWFHQGTPKRLLWALHGAFRCGVQKRSATVEVVTSFAKRRDYAVGTQAARRCCQWPRGVLWGLRKGSCGRCMEHSAAACRGVQKRSATVEVVTSFAKRRDYAVGTQAARRCCQCPRGLLWGL